MEAEAAAQVEAAAKVGMEAAAKAKATTTSAVEVEAKGGASAAAVAEGLAAFDVSLDGATLLFQPATAGAGGAVAVPLRHITGARVDGDTRLNVSTDGSGGLDPSFSLELADPKVRVRVRVRAITVTVTLTLALALTLTRCSARGWRR